MIRTMTTTDGRYEYERTTRHRVTNNSAEKAMRRMKTDDIFEDERTMRSLIFVNLRRALHLPTQGRQCEILNHGDSRLQQGQGPQKHSCMATPSFSKGKARRNIAATRPSQAMGPLISNGILDHIMKYFIGSVRLQRMTTTGWDP